MKQSVSILSSLPLASLFVLMLIASCYPAWAADKVYKWKDERGVTHFSNKSTNNPEAKIAKLPEINRGEFKLVEQQVATCDGHGGIDCSAGPDTDGSVICYDGFQGAITRYRFSCNSPKLEIAEVGDLEEDGSFSVFVRNSKSVAANKPALYVKPPEGRELPLAGPDQIDAYDVGEFRFIGDDNQTVTLRKKPTIAQLQLTCANCP